MPGSDIRLVINADDFGLSPAISRGILRAHRDGVVTSTSLLGNVADLDGARTLLAEAPGLGVGVHLALTGGSPVAPPDRVPSLLAAADAGTFHARGHDFITAWVRGRVAAQDVERELDAQVGRIRDAGIPVDHLDTHHHLGFLPVVGRAVETVARRHGISGIRSAVERPTLAWVTEPRRGLEASLLTGLAWLTRRQLGARRHGPQSWGYVEAGHLDEIRILEIIGRLSTGPHELICHPGEDDPDAHRVEEPGRYQRLLELAALTSDKVRRGLGQRAIALCRWGDLV
ncbi:MAG TPA: ChbG/HpnK family deacetylase [Polyangia bacterium]|nr:ChbG/HpnK family deacetylase [Polyangia bacterium]